MLREDKVAMSARRFLSNGSQQTQEPCPALNASPSITVFFPLLKNHHFIEFGLTLKKNTSKSDEKMVKFPLNIIFK